MTTDSGSRAGAAAPAMTRRTLAAATAAACLVFAAYAGSFLYFFVDDEAIPLVYARNLLRGRGLVYTALEGRGEGYSDFLHVLWSTVLLTVTRGLHLSHLAPLLIGKAISLAAGLGIIIVVGWWLRRSGATTPGLTAALGFLALAGPLALWSCSSLETSAFALMLTGLATALLTGAPTAAVVLAILLTFERIDGPLFVAVLLGAAFCADRRRLRDLWHVAWPVGLAALAFHGWRWSYFGSLVPEPLAAKVLYRLAGSSHAVVKPAREAYLLGFLRVYGVAAAPPFLVAVAAAWRVPAARLAALALLGLGTYVAVVGDWMFGWRFTVALLPLAAVIIGMAVSRAPGALAWSATAVVLAWSALGARTFLASYVAIESRPIFWTHPQLGASAWLAPYYDLVAASRRIMHAGDRVGYNQAGLLPYLLDVENIDDLGICSRFVSYLPTTDVYYTGVGRYSPLTNQPVLRTAHAYLLYQDVQFLVARTDLLWKANHDTIPEQLLDGYFRLDTIDASGANAIYRRTARPAAEYRRDPGLFWQNLSHTSSLTRAAIDGRTIQPAAFGSELPVLRELSNTWTSSGAVELDLTLGRRDADVHALYIGQLTLTRPGTISVALFDAAGHETLHRTIAAGPGQTSVLERIEPAVRATAASLIIDTGKGDRLTIADLRVEGQSASLRDYLRHQLRFP